MKNKSIVFTAAVILAARSVLAAGVVKTGTVAAPFLKIDVGARGTAMGGAFTAVANDASAMFWNPAGIAGLRKSELVVSHAQWLADVAHNYTGFAMPLGSFGVLGANATFVTMDAMERTTVEEPDGTGEFFDMGSLAFGLTYARALTDRFYIGFNGKYVQESIYNSRARGLALDIGTLFTTQFHDLKIGMSISNFGTKMRMAGDDMLVQHDIDPITTGNNGNINADLRTDAFDLPLLFRVGVSMDLLGGRDGSHLILAMDALHPNDNAESLNVGGEYAFKGLFYLRAGYKSLFAENSQQGLTLGGGLAVKLGSAGKIMLDYAYQDFGILNNVQRFSIGFGL